jgi:predicted RNA-binding Zn-ribbon protein involved in translation (DUF1610 family)
MNGYNLYEKMKCFSCNGVIHVDVDRLPGDIKAGEAAEILCPYCGKEEYAELVEEEQSIVKPTEKVKSE